MFGMIANGNVPWERYLMASHLPVSLFDMREIDIFKLDGWRIEQRLLCDMIWEKTRLPDVLTDIIISYVGSTHTDALHVIGRSLSRASFERIGIQHISHARKTTKKLLANIAQLVKYPKLTKQPVEMSAIINLAGRVVNHDDWPNESGWPLVADIFYQILLLAWPDTSKKLISPAIDTKRDITNNAG
jgi:hypothetical protein